MSHPETEALIRARWKELGYDELLPEERDYIVLWWLVGEVINGGFHQYFSNSAGDAALEARTALAALKAEESLAVLDGALAAFAEVGGYSPDHETREERIDQMRDAFGPFDRATEQFHQLPEDFLNLALKRVARVHVKKGVRSAED